MSCGHQDLPLPPQDKSGWPWYAQVSQGPPLLPSERPWPKISIVTPSYNQGRFIERTIRSVLLQGYPNLEYFVIDGGSSDETLEVIRKYEPWLTGWVSETDSGQSDAINKGLEKCSGEYFNWLNSDDALLPGALIEVGRLASGEPAHFIAGSGTYTCARSGDVVDPWSQATVQGGQVTFPVSCPTSCADILNGKYQLYQPSTFLYHPLIVKVGGVRADFHYYMDNDLWLRMLVATEGTVRSVATNRVLSEALIHPEAKTMAFRQQFRVEAVAGLQDLLGVLGESDRQLAEKQIRKNERITRMRKLESIRSSTCLIEMAMRHPSLVATRTFWRAMKESVVHY